MQLRLAFVLGLIPELLGSGAEHPKGASYHMTQVTRLITTSDGKNKEVGQAMAINKHGSEVKVEGRTYQKIGDDIVQNDKNECLGEDCLKKEKLKTILPAVAPAKEAKELVEDAEEMEAERPVETLETAAIPDPAVTAAADYSYSSSYSSSSSAIMTDVNGKVHSSASAEEKYRAADSNGLNEQGEGKLLQKDGRKIFESTKTCSNDECVTKEQKAAERVGVNLSKEVVEDYENLFPL